MLNGVDLAFDPDKLPREFKLGFSFRVVGVDYAHWQVFRRRAKQGQTPAQVFAEMKTRMKRILDPLMIELEPRALMCSNAEFWRIAGQTFDEVFALRLGEEFGLRIKVADAKRELDAFVKTMTKKLASIPENQQTKMLANIEKAQDRLDEVLEFNDFDPTHPEVVQAQANVDNLEKVLHERKDKAIEQHVLTSAGIPGTESVPMLESTLGRIRHTLGLSTMQLSLETEGVDAPIAHGRSFDPVVGVLEDNGYANIKSESDGSTGARKYVFTRGGSNYVIKMSAGNDAQVQAVLVNNVKRTDLDLSPSEDVEQSVQSVLEQLVG